MRIVFWVARGLFILLAAGAGLVLTRRINEVYDAAVNHVWVMLGAAIGAGVLALLDWVSPRKSISKISAVAFGLIVGVGLGALFRLVVALTPIDPRMLNSVQLVLTVLFCYVAVAIILQTQHDFRFVIPYVEFSKQIKGTRPLILDTNVIIDGRVADICETRIIDSPVVVPRFVLQELQEIADSTDRLTRNKGRRGLDILNRLQRCEKVDVSIHEAPSAPGEQVDSGLLKLAKELDGRIMTNDFNLNKIAQLQGVEVINVNELANALKPAVIPGEEMTLNIIRPGDQPGQGVGYLDDGTMVVVEQGREQMGKEVRVVVNSVYQTQAGRMIFAKLK
jgi:uncharacterized protein YacL